mmetsp:Transcript_88343/g.152987  ORF Transcript_88343/g.152987 Transcript_88343/m.152987 type:complete len:99 (-) Transcript_88343:3-299(-)
MEESEEVPGPTVNTTVYMREKPEAEYVLHLRQEGVSIADMNQNISWWFPGGDASLDKVEIDGKEYTPDSWPKGSDTAVKEGSEVKAYKTILEDEEEED